MGQIYLLRHGQADLLGDDYDCLSELGRAQAQLSGKALAARGVRPVLVVSGALRRQSETARHAAEAAGWAVERRVDSDFDEYTHADLFTGAFPHLPDHAAIAALVAAKPEPRRAYQEIFEAAFTAWLSGAAGTAGLSWSSFRDRVVAALGRVGACCGKGECVVIVTSGGVIAAICQSLLGLPDAHILKLHNPLHNASITRLLTRGEEISLSGFNDISHLAVIDGGRMVTYR